MNKRLWACLFFALFFAFLGYQRLAKPRVMVIHSYDRAFSWVRDLNAGFFHALKGSSEAEVRTFYMRTKHRSDPVYLEKQRRAAQQAIAAFHPQILVLFDDHAQEWVGRRYLGPGAPQVVFAGVNNAPEAYGYRDAENVWGVLERLPYQAIEESLRQILPADMRRFTFISDRSRSSRLLYDRVSRFDWRFFRESHHCLCATLEEWQACLREAKRTSDFALVGYYQAVQGERGSLFGKAVERAMALNPLPLVGLSGPFVEDGGALSLAVSAYSQGKTAGTIAAQLIAGERPQPAIVTDPSFGVFYRPAAFERNFPGIRLPLIYQAFAREGRHTFGAKTL